MISLLLCRFGTVDNFSHLLQNLIYLESLLYVFITLDRGNICSMESKSQLQNLHFPNVLIIFAPCVSLAFLGFLGPYGSPLIPFQFLSFDKQIRFPFFMTSLLSCVTGKRYYLNVSRCLP